MLAHSSENSEAASVVKVLCWVLGIRTKVTSHCGTHSLERGTWPPKVTTEIAHEVFLLGHPEVSVSVQAGLGT